MNVCLLCVPVTTSCGVLISSLAGSPHWLTWYTCLPYYIPQRWLSGRALALWVEGCGFLPINMIPDASLLSTQHIRIGMAQTSFQNEMDSIWNERLRLITSWNNLFHNGPLINKCQLSFPYFCVGQVWSICKMDTYFFVFKLFSSSLNEGLC